MGKSQKIVMTVLWGALVLMMLGIITLRALRIRAQASDDTPVNVNILPPSSPPPTAPGNSLPVLFQAPAFSLTDQDGKTITNHDLAGHVWVIDFVFTHCAGPCPIMTAKMADVQTRVTNPAVKFVSVSVDPERDTPQVLKEYAKTFKADESRWHFLTGKKSDVFDTVRGFNLSAKPADSENEIMHDERILLIDAVGNIRGIYHFRDDGSIDKLVADATALSSGSTAPTAAPTSAPVSEGNTQP